MADCDGLMMAIAQRVSHQNPSDSDKAGLILDVVFGFLRKHTDFFQVDKTRILKSLESAVDRQLAAALMSAKEQTRTVEKPPRQVLPPPITDGFDEVKTDGVIRDESRPEPPVSPSDEPTEFVPPPGNGGVCDNYVWTQSLQEAVMNIPVHLETNKRMIRVVMMRGELEVRVGGETALSLDGKFHSAINVEDSHWYLDDSGTSKTLVLNLSKAAQAWWPCVLQGHPTVDITKCQPETSKLSDLDGATRAEVEKMMINQNRKMAGLPSLEEQKNQDLIKKFMSQQQAAQAHH